MTDLRTEPGSSQSGPDQLGERVQDVVGQVQERAQQAGGQTRERVREQIDTRSTQAGEQIQVTAQAMRRASTELRDAGKEGPANLINQVAERGERLGGYLSEASGERILRDVEDVARRQPWLIAGGSVVLGFLGSRFMKASSSRRYSGGYATVAGASETARTPASLPPGSSASRTDAGEGGPEDVAVGPSAPAGPVTGSPSRASGARGGSSGGA
jgi:hypothetical protein